MTTKLDLKIRQGETFQRVIRWQRRPYIFKAITAIAQVAPVLITAPGHGLTEGWPAAVVSVVGMDEINAPHSPPRDYEFYPVTLAGDDAVTINDINAAGYSAYTSGGYLQFLTPVDLEGYTARIKIKDEIDGEVLLELTTENARIAIDVDNKTITLLIDAEDTAADVLTWEAGVWDLEMISASGQVTTLYSGSITVVREVTTT